jgi:hypothetical protein
MTDWATPQAVEDAATQWNEGQIRCRAYGSHAWQALTVYHRPGVWTEVQRCDRCRNERQQEVDERGYPLGSWRPAYIPGYLLRGVGRLGTDGRAVLRLTTLRAAHVIEEPVT